MIRVIDVWIVDEATEGGDRGSEGPSPAPSTPPGHHEATDEADDEGADAGGGHGHRQLLGRVVGSARWRMNSRSGRVIPVATQFYNISHWAGSL